MDILYNDPSGQYPFSFIRSDVMPCTSDSTPFIPWTSSEYWGEFRALMIGMGLEPHTTILLRSMNLTN